MIDYADIAGGHRRRRDAGPAEAARVRRRPRALRPEPGRAVGPRHRRLRRLQPLLRELRRPGRRLLRHPVAEASKPEIYPIYWSSAQMEARQHPRMATVQAFLNSQWISETDGHRWFDPDHDTPLPRPDPPPPAGRRLRRPGHPPGPGHPRPVDDRGLPAALPAPVRRRLRRLRPLGRRPTGPRPRSTRARPCARRSAPSRAGPR